MKRLQITESVRACSLASISLCVFAIAGCGGGGNDGAPAAGTSAAAVSADSVAGSTESQVQPAPVTAPAIATAPAAAAPAALAAGAPAATPVAAPSSATSTLDLAVYKLGAASNVGAARLSGSVLTLDGTQFRDTTLTAGSCTVGGGAFSQCASVSSQPTFSLCSSNNGGGINSDKIRSRYVLFDPHAVRITDAATLQNRRFDGYENCGQDNVGAQPKGAPSSTLQFNASGGFTLTRYDRNPARTDTLPAGLLDINKETTNGGNSASFALYRINGRYLIIATTAPTSGPTAAEPGTLTAFIER